MRTGLECGHWKTLPLLELGRSQTDPSTHTFATPTKRINSHDDLNTFLSSAAHTTLTSFLNLLNASVTPISTDPPTDYRKLFTNSPSITVSPAVQSIISLVSDLTALVDTVPPEEGPRRFGNKAFRTWTALVAERINAEDGLLEKYLPSSLLSLPGAKDELKSYLLNAFGSGQRLDYGTGHELSFLAFICALYLLGFFTPSSDEPALATKALKTYLILIRKLVKTYNLEPAGSHGVWGLDDHSFLPYIFGSAQLTTCPVNGKPERGVPKQGDVVKKETVDDWRERNLYFDAIGFINDVKTGPFWEHSPILYDVSGVQGGWAKINQGMIKMYHAEVLGKFPVVQHFHFGSIFPFPELSSEPHAQPKGPVHSGSSYTPAPIPASQPPTRAPWATPSAARPSGAALPGTPRQPPMEGTRAPWAAAGASMPPPPGPEGTRAPWAAGGPPLGPEGTKAPWATGGPGKMPPPPGPEGTKAPWAK
ncbi:Phosphotyrosyl phosphatase activator [Ascobolus immersus RN42]|uniref:Serine/threonine-protein phosphatase 2A activator n=1 Tax=Ascobolus immersus RN42 TaxID=1160509 RepID=A0A3N4III4_ASCIM|nr:Phosphotyrosyl phosphatase activator [Ascobolus immersus RN42]